MLKSLSALLMISAAFMAAACGSNDSETIPVTQFTGFVNGASGSEGGVTISANKVVNGQISAAQGDVFPDSTASAAGVFSFGTLDYTGPIHFATDGNPSLTATLSATPLNNSVALSITPYTTVVSQAALAAGGLSTTNLNNAEAAVGTWLNNQIDVHNTVPVNPASANANQASQASKFYYLLNGGLGRLAQELTLTNTEITQALIDDASDGTFDGMNGGNPIAGVAANSFTMGLADCVIAFETESSSLTIDAAAFTAFTNAIQNFNGNLTGGGN